MIFDDMKRILHENREQLMSSDRSMRIVLLLFESKAGDQLAVAVQDMMLAVLPSEDDAASLSDSRLRLQELRRQDMFSWHQAFIDLVDELVANLQVGLGLDSLRTDKVRGRSNHSCCCCCQGPDCSLLSADYEIPGVFHGRCAAALGARWQACYSDWCGRL